MRTLALPEVLNDNGEPMGYGDLTVDQSGNLALADGLPALQQRVIQRLRFWQHEWYLNFPDGVPYYSRIFQRPVNAGLASAILVSEVMKVAEVERVSAVTVSLNPFTRELSFSCTIHSAFGSGPVSLEVLPNAN